MIQKILVVAGLVCGIGAVIASKAVFGVEPVQLAGSGVVLLAVAMLL